MVRQLVRVESPSSDADSQQAIFELLHHWLESLQYRCSYFPGIKYGGDLLALPKKRDRAKPVQLLLGHVDTVWPKGTLQQMPLQVNEVNGRRTLAGPGSYDMKAGVAMMIMSLMALQELDLEPEFSPVIYLNSDEELNSEESQRHIELLAQAVDRVFVLEPSLGPDGKLKTARKGVAHYTITVNGKPSHAGLAPEEGASAILEMSHVVQTLFGMNDPSRGITVNVGIIEGGERINMMAARARAEVDVRVSTMEDATYIEQQINNIRPVNRDTQIDVQGYFERLPMEKHAKNNQLWDMARSIGNSLGYELEDAMSGGASDGNYTSQYTATLDGLGAVGNGAHAWHEHIDIDKTIERGVLLTHLLLAPPTEKLM